MLWPTEERACPIYGSLRRSSYPPRQMWVVDVVAYSDDSTLPFSFRPTSSEVGALMLRALG